jgi:hypothetical protein
MKRCAIADFVEKCLKELEQRPPLRRGAFLFPDIPYKPKKQRRKADHLPVRRVK